MTTSIKTYLKHLVKNIPFYCAVFFYGGWIFGDDKRWGLLIISLVLYLLHLIINFYMIKKQIKSQFILKFNNPNDKIIKDGKEIYIKDVLGEQIPDDDFPVSLFCEANGQMDIVVYKNT